MIREFLRSRRVVPVLFVLLLPLWGASRLQGVNYWTGHPWNIEYYGTILGMASAPLRFFPWYYDQNAVTSFVERGDALAEWTPGDPQKALYLHTPPWEPGMVFPLTLLNRALRMPLRMATLVGCQIGFDAAVLAALGWLGFEIGGAAGCFLALLVYASWPTVGVACGLPFYYYWPNVFTVAAAMLLSLFHRHLGEQRRWWLCLAIGAAAGGWCWFRGTAATQLLALPLVVACLYSTRKQAFRSIIMVALGAAIVLTPAAVHNWPRNRSIMPRGQIWHDLYVGIGTRPNPYGIRHVDAYAGQFVWDKYHIQFQQPGYEEALRNEYLAILRSNPGLLARNFVLNVRDSMTGWSFATDARVPRRFFWLGALLGILALALRRNPIWRLLTAALLIWLVQCMTLSLVNRPQESYLWETLSISVLCGTAGLGAIVSLAWTAMTSRVAGHARRRSSNTYVGTE
jgi:hypothetical protein